MTNDTNGILALTEDQTAVLLWGLSGPQSHSVFSGVAMLLQLLLLLVVVVGGGLVVVVVVAVVALDAYAQLKQICSRNHAKRTAQCKGSRCLKTSLHFLCTQNLAAKLCDPLT